MLSAKERKRAKAPGRRRMRLASSPSVRSRTWWLRFSMPQWPRMAPAQALASRGSLAGVVGDFAALRPQAGAGVPAQGAAGDAHDAGDEGPPVGIETVGRGEDLDP